MTGAGGGEGDRERRPPSLSIGERIGVLQRRVLRHRRVRWAMELLKVVGDAGGALLAAGLAFNALFALIPALLFVVGLLGFVVGDAGRAQAIVVSIADRVPAMTELVDAILEGMLDQRDAFSIIGVIGFAWGASGFYGALDEAMRRLFPGGTPRGVVEQRLRGLLAMVLLVGAALSSVVLASALSLLEGLLLLPGWLDSARLFGTLAMIAIFSVVMWLTYVIVPAAGAGPRMSILPALLAGTAAGLLTSLFSLVAPILVGRLAALGILAALFTALIWLRLVFEILVYGGAWARLRRDRKRRRTAPPSLDAA